MYIYISISIYTYACTYLYTFVNIPQENMVSGNWTEVHQVAGDFYDKLQSQNAEAFEKLVTETGPGVMVPVFPQSCREEGWNEVGSWMFSDPSVWATKSWLVGKWKSIKPQFEKIVANHNFVEKLAMVVSSIMVAMLASLALSHAEQFSKLMELSKFVAELAIFFTLLKLLKVAHIIELVLWKSLGTSFKTEFAQICAGGNVNKLLSMCASKMSMAKRDDMDTAENIKMFLESCPHYSADYLVEGVRRRCQRWVESRRRNGDLAPDQFLESWETIRTMGFEAAVDAEENWVERCRRTGDLEEAERHAEIVLKFWHVHDLATEIAEMSSY